MSSEQRRRQGVVDPSLARRARRAIRRRLCSKPPAHYLHLGKTGGTAVKDALRDHQCDGAYRLELHPHRIRLADVPPGERFFFALRDPATRFVSAFYSRQRQGRPRYDRPWNDRERAVFERFGTANDVAEALESEDDDLRTAARAAMGAVQHFEPQLAWFGSVAQLEERLDDLLLVLFQETLTTDFARLTHLLGVKAALPEGDVEAHRNPADVDRRLSDLAVRNLRRWYEADHRLIDWCRQLPAATGIPSR